ncbi:methyltransferase family protein [Lacipirellula sp.]|uniref:methyltransferase family protein n=1 Tax=Lacipirellula sp. TaxID=2691419 RepID=UPI003D14276F
MAQDWIAFVARHRIRATTIIVILLIVWKFASPAVPRESARHESQHLGIGLLLVVCGLALRTWSAGTLRKHQGLTTTGPYSIIRNPLYVGTFMMVGGFALLANASAVVWGAAGACLAMCICAVLHEERILSTHFGNAWLHYTRATPRFVPRRLMPRNSTWTLQEWVRNREYQAVLATMAGLSAIIVWDAF